MNNFLIILLLIILLAFAVRRALQKARRGGGCCGEHEQTEARRRVSDRNKAHYPYEIIIPVVGMTCENCAVKLENALNSLSGVWAKVDIAKNEAQIRCKTSPDEKLLRQTIVDVGYIPM